MCARHPGLTSVQNRQNEQAMERGTNEKVVRYTCTSPGLSRLGNQSIKGAPYERRRGMQWEERTCPTEPFTRSFERRWLVLWLFFVWLGRICKNHISPVHPHVPPARKKRGRERRMHGTGNLDGAQTTVVGAWSTKQRPRKKIKRTRPRLLCCCIRSTRICAKKVGLIDSIDCWHTCGTAHRYRCC